MPRRAPLTPRKEPRQARSLATTEAILEAATRILSREGAARLNTNRVAEVAGVSVGSLYQYFPNKEALLFRLQEREFERTFGEIAAILADGSSTHRARVFAAVRHFFATEAEEATLRAALALAQLQHRDTAEYHALEGAVFETVRAFLREALGPDARGLDFKAELMITIAGAVAERVTTRPRPPAHLRRWSRTVAALLCHELGL